jgi:N-methylhydantoinase A/oxoprolinase/acetone carboxylase beta subunit
VSFGPERSWPCEEDVVLEYNFDGWYQGQSWDLRATVRPPDESDDILEEMHAEFTESHEALRGFSLDDAPIRCL